MGGGGKNADRRGEKLIEGNSKNEGNRDGGRNVGRRQKDEGREDAARGGGEGIQRIK